MRSYWVLTLPTLAVLVGWSTRAQAQVQNCAPDQFVDRTAPGADRQLTWDFDIATDLERCMQVQTGQNVVWNANPDFGAHPLIGSGGDTPNPINSNLPDPSANSYAVTFDTPGTFGYFCTNHPGSMKGAIKVVPAPRAPAMTPWLDVTLTALLMVMGWLLLRNHRSQWA